MVLPILEATRSRLEVLEGGTNANPGTPGLVAANATRVVVVSHDAHPHGAQYLALNLCKELRAMGFAVDAVLLGDGALESRFAEVATLHKLAYQGTEQERDDLARSLAKAGATVALANTTVSGLFAANLARAGLTVVALVHELAGVIRQYSLQEHAVSIAAAAHRVVFAAEPVCAGFVRFARLRNDQPLIRPQGIYRRNQNRSPAAVAAARMSLRRKLALPDDARIVLGVGYADLRKGVDLFVEAARVIVASDPRHHLVWVGHFDRLLEPEIRARVVQLNLHENVHFPGHTADIDDYYAGADIFGLTSREDPFPSVVLESLEVGVPVVAFSGTGGAEGLLRRGCGRLVEGLDAGKFAQACLQLLTGRDGTSARLARPEKPSRKTEFSFRSYVFDLLAAGGLDMPRISVVVPNYNYAHLLMRGCARSRTRP